MHKSFRYGILSTVLIGLLFQFQSDLKSVGLLLLFLILPVLLVIVLSTTSTALLTTEKKLSRPFLATIATTTVSLLLYVAMRILHLPGTPEMFTIATSLSILTVIVGCLYVYLNTNVLGPELILIFLPVVMVVWHVVPLNTRSQHRPEYPELISNLIWSQEAVFGDAVNECDVAKTVADFRTKLIDHSGGRDENGVMLGVYNTELVEIYRQHAADLVDSLAPSYLNRTLIADAANVGELVLCLGELTNQVFADKCL
ncbi:hypothetical protein RT717_03840 [Imperialibacter roseus]|uniref:Uncharacterized protein n=1 Tax=Imperialibacter roseus TaxID=1324217 RepID=A0ABZ0IRV4_9BACT|nr:hypothetical protein [Imperialibacter roseus]WOK07755.1 hypothetical protein RT717_03840 [Imperialibacter roseus]